LGISFIGDMNFYDDWENIFPELSLLVENIDVLIEDYKNIQKVIVYYHFFIRTIPLLTKFVVDPLA